MKTFDELPSYRVKNMGWEAVLKSDVREWIIARVKELQVDYNEAKRFGDTYMRNKAIKIKFCIDELKTLFNIKEEKIRS
jgi:hypothetical protein